MKIEDYGMIGDLQTVALVGSDSARAITLAEQGAWVGHL